MHTFLNNSSAAHILILLTGIFISACNGNKIAGRVIDCNSNGVENVLIKIQNSENMAKTDAEGYFSLRTTRTDLTLQFLKKGFTTHKIKLETENNKVKPLEPLVIYPIPEKDGFFYVGKNGLQELKPEKLLQTKSRNNVTRSINIKIFTPRSTNTVLDSGDILFINASPMNQKLAQTREFGVIHHSAKHYSFGENILFSGFRNNPAFSEVGEERLRILKTRLTPGDYTWIGFDKLNFNSSIYDNSTVSFPFSVEEQFSEVKNLETSKVETASSGLIDHSK